MLETWCHFGLHSSTPGQLLKWTNQFLDMYQMAQIFDGENFDKFDESKLYGQNFPCQYFAIGKQEFKHLYL